ncbi:hypothetical protein FB451DRAFT_1487286 [Mycena latifolia]|nr:hypothetical protein FB451DRAFT_1487286 [Mycena latifolia]
MHLSMLSASFVALLVLVPHALAAPLAVAMALTPGGYRFNASIHDVPLDGHIAHVGSHLHVINATGQVVQINVLSTLERRGVPAGEPGGQHLGQRTSRVPALQLPFSVHGSSLRVAGGREVKGLFLGFHTDCRVLFPRVRAERKRDASWSARRSRRDAPSGTIDGFNKPLMRVAFSGGGGGGGVVGRSPFAHIHSTALTIHGSAPLSWATETLEAYGVTGADDYPAGSTVFSKINVALAGGVVPAVAWGNADDVADGLTTTVDVDGATDAQITITFQGARHAHWITVSGRKFKTYTYMRAIDVCGPCKVSSTANKSEGMQRSWRFANVAYSHRRSSAGLCRFRDRCMTLRAGSRQIEKSRRSGR